MKLLNILHICSIAIVKHSSDLAQGLLVLAFLSIYFSLLAPCNSHYLSVSIYMFPYDSAILLTLPSPWSFHIFLEMSITIVHILALIPPKFNIFPFPSKNFVPAQNVPFISYKPFQNCQMFMMFFEFIFPCSLFVAIFIFEDVTNCYV